MKRWHDMPVRSPFEELMQFLHGERWIQEVEALLFPMVIRRCALVMVQGRGGFAGTTMQDQHEPTQKRPMKALRPIPRGVADGYYPWSALHTVVVDTPNMAAS